MTNDKSVEVWLRMYEEQVRHARHHEVLRTQSTNLVVVISAALLALYGTEAVKVGDTLIGLFMVGVNAYGLLMSLKHYERSRLHISVGSEYRNTVSAHTAINEKTLNDARKNGRSDHKENSRMSSIRAYVLWYGLHGLLIVLGAGIVIRAHA